MRTRDGSKGGVLIELAFVLPMILSIGFVIFEFVQIIRHVNVAASLSREMANIVLRECPSDVGPEMVTCFAEKQTAFNTYANTLVPNTRIIISFAHRETNLAPNNPEIVIGNGLGGISSNQYIDANGSSVALTNAGTSQASRIVNQLNSGANGLRQTMRYMDHIYIAEAYVPYLPIISVIGNFFPFITEGNYYDVTII